MLFRIFTFYLFLNWFSTYISDNRKYVCGRMLYACINPWKFKGLDSREITSLPEIKKVILHGTSFQSSPKITLMLITNPFAYKKNLQHLTIAVLLIKSIFFRPLSSVHFFQSNQRFQAVEFVDRHILENL